jgi:hypothetical protein
MFVGRNDDPDGTAVSPAPRKSRFHHAACELAFGAFLVSDGLL